MIKKFVNYPSDIKLILITTLLSNVGIFMVIPFLAIYLNELTTISTVDVGIIIGIAFWCQRAGSLFGGVLSDYVNIKQTMLLGLAIRIPGYVLVGFTHDFYLLILSCSLIGLGSSLYLPAAKSFLVKKTNSDRRVNVLSTRVVFSNIGVAIGPLIGMAVFKISPIILFSSVGLIFSVLFIFNLKLDNIVGETQHKTHYVSDFNHLLKNKAMIMLSVFTFIFMAFYMQIEVTIPMFSQAVFGRYIIPYLFICNAIIVVFFQMSISAWACDEKNPLPLIVAFLLFAIAFIILDSLHNSYSALFLSIILFSLAQIILQIKLDYDATNINENMIATVFGIMSLSGAFGGMFGSYIGTLLYSKTLFGLSVWEIFAGSALIASLLYFITPKIRSFKESNNKIAP